MYAEIKEIQREKSGSDLINKVNELQAKYQAAIQGLSEEEKEAVKHTELFGELYGALSVYIEHCVEQALFKSGIEECDLDVQGVKEMVLDTVFGLKGKAPLYDDFRSENGAKFSTYCYAVVSNIVKYAIRQEKDHLLKAMCLNKAELDAMRKWKLYDLTDRIADLEEEEETLVSKLFKNPQQVYEEQCYLEQCIKKLKEHMEIVAEGPELKARSTSNKPVYKWVGGSVGAYLSPVAKSEWVNADWELDMEYKTASLLQKIAFWVAYSQAAETLGIVIADRAKDADGVSATELSVTEKLSDQMVSALRTTREEEADRIRKEGVSQNKLRKLTQVYYMKLASEYRAEVSADAEFALAWLWRVIRGLSAREAAWLFARELNACVPVLEFDWKEPLKETLTKDMYSELYEDVTAEKTTQKWPKDIRDGVFEIQNERERKEYELLLDAIKEEALSLEALTDRKGEAGFDGL